jgi:hypothetical protein
VTAHKVCNCALSGESGVQVAETDPPIVLWAPPGQYDQLVVAVYDDKTIVPHPDGVIIQDAQDASDPFWPR